MWGRLGHAAAPLFLTALRSAAADPMQPNNYFCKDGTAGVLPGYCGCLCCRFVSLVHCINDTSTLSIPVLVRVRVHADWPMTCEAPFDRWHFRLTDFPVHAWFGPSGYGGNDGDQVSPFKLSLQTSSRVAIHRGCCRCWRTRRQTSTWCSCQTALTRTPRGTSRGASSNSD
jgi:hypothetical protein